jgi:hypothetical protein
MTALDRFRSTELNNAANLGVFTAIRLVVEPASLEEGTGRCGMRRCGRRRLGLRAS